MSHVGTSMCMSVCASMVLTHADHVGTMGHNSTRTTAVDYTIVGISSTSWALLDKIATGNTIFRSPFYFKITTKPSNHCWHLLY